MTTEGTPREGRLMAEIKDPAEAKRMQAAVNSWVWIDGRPAVICQVVDVRPGVWGVVVQLAGIDEAVYVDGNGRPLTFGQDARVLETWMSREYVAEATEGGDMGRTPGETTDRNECTCECHEEGSQVAHFDACCNGRCRHCGRHYNNLKRHHADCHPDEPDRPPGQRKPRHPKK